MLLLTNNKHNPYLKILAILIAFIFSFESAGYCLRVPVGASERAYEVIGEVVVEPLRNQEGESFSEFLERLRREHPDALRPDSTITFLNPETRIAETMSYIDFLEKVKTRDGRIIAPEFLDYADKISRYNTAQLDKEAEPFLKRMSDVSEPTISNFIEILSEDVGDGLRHHIANPHSVVVILKDALDNETDSNASEKMQQLLLNEFKWQVILNEIIYRWNLPGQLTVVKIPSAADQRHPTGTEAVSAIQEIVPDLQTREGI